MYIYRKLGNSNHPNAKLYRSWCGIWSKGRAKRWYPACETKHERPNKPLDVEFSKSIQLPLNPNPLAEDTLRNAIQSCRTRSMRLDIISRPNALSYLLPSLLLAPLLKSLFHTTQPNVLDVIPLQAR
jgi:hypothetical protein